ncbi:hypothetical protein [Kitasatospora sp. NPDC088134]|uniref:hypothetical protein n=1 Tax=Kitasatospora sp. NPDC088134 TaxID=3364071 RepID=UPI0037F8AC35
MVVTVPSGETMEQLVPTLVRVRRENADLAAVMLRPGVPAEQLPDDLPADLRRLLALTDGPCFGVRASLHPADEIGYFQDLDALADAAGIPNAGDYLNIGSVNEAPLLYDRRDGSIWVARADSGLWYQGCTLERTADSLDGFVSEWVAGPRFPELVRLPAGDGDEDVLAWDDWWRLLQAAGRVPA